MRKKKDVCVLRTAYENWKSEKCPTLQDALWQCKLLHLVGMSGMSMPCFVYFADR